MGEQKKWRLGLDLGTNSLGWAALELDDSAPPRRAGLLDLGVRIFSDARDPQSKESNAATRRGPRGARRNRDRYLQRRAKFLRGLIETGLLPADKAKRHQLERLEDPWILRARALSEPLSIHEVGRALFHLQQRRGFKSNRLTDRGSDEKGAVESGAEAAWKEMREDHAATLGQLKGRDRQSTMERNRELPKGGRDPMPLARVRSHSEGSKLVYEYYPLRSMIEDEFDAIWDAQADHHPEEMTEEARNSLRETLSFQRPLKPQPVGRCTFESDEERAPNALPSVQRLRIYQELNNLRVSTRPGEPQLPLSRDKRNKLAEIALSKPKLSLTDMRKVLGLSSAATFSIEAAGRDYLDGDRANDIITRNRKSNTGNWPEWADMPEDEQDALAEILVGRVEPGKGSHPAVARTHQIVVERIAKGLNLPESRAHELLEAKDEATLTAFLSERYGLDADHAGRIASLRLPDGHGRLSRTAGAKVLSQLIEPDENGELRTYDKAVVAAGYFHYSLKGTGQVFDRLPYYGVVLEQSVAFGTGAPDDLDEKRIGKLANPTVHVALNQLRKVVNALIDRFGPPEQIVVELSRDLPLGAVEKNKLEKRQRDNRQKNEERAEDLAKYGQNNTYSNRLLLRLWEELDATGRKCPFSGQHLSQNMLWSGELEVEHILPFSRTLDDSFNNKVLALREANRRKGRRSPWEAVEEGIFDRETIANSLRDLPKEKAWRFGPDAMERFENEERDFLDRQLNDNKHISRLAAQYLKSLGSDVWVINGRLTADLRHHWGLNSVLTGHNRAPADSEAKDVKKNRNDHRHHAVDAFVIGCTDRSMVKAAADEAKRVEEEFAAGQRDHRRLLAGIPDPFDGYLLAVKEAAGKIVVSHKPDHGIEGKLHEDTNYGVVRTQSGETRLATRKPIVGLTPGEIRSIGDDRIRRELMELTDGLGDKERKQALVDYSNRPNGPKRVRIHKVQANFERIEHGPDSKGKAHVRAVIPGDNYCMDIVETPDGKWHGAAVSRFQTHKFKHDDEWKGLWRKAHPDARLVMRVRNGDLIKMEHEGTEQVMRVVRLNPSGNRLYLAAANEAGDYQARHDDPEDDFRWDLATIGKLKSRKARLVRATPDGQLIDPGSPA